MLSSDHWISVTETMNQIMGHEIKTIGSAAQLCADAIAQGGAVPLLHDYNSYQIELMLFGPRKEDVGAYRTGPGQSLIPPPDGFAKHTKPAAEDAVSFIIETIHYH